MRLSMRVQSVSSFRRPGESAGDFWRRLGPRLARPAWLLIFGMALLLFFFSLPLYYEQLTTLCTRVNGCAETQIRAATAASLAEFGITLRHYAIYNIVLALVLNVLSSLLAYLIFWRRAPNWFSFVISLMLALLYTFPAIDTLPATYPALALPVHFIGFFTGSSVPLLFYAFPNGRFVPRFTRWLALLWIILMFSDNFFQGTPWHISRLGWIEPFLGLFFLTFAGAQLYRYRTVASGVERQQTKWVVYGFLVGVATMTFFNVLLTFEPPELRGGSLLSVAKEMGDTLFAFVLSFSLGVAILRYRLWDIDVLIRRTLVYATLVTTLSLVYFGSVILLQSLFRSLTGQDSDLAIVLSTLVIAALFAPLLQRVRTFIDQRFYRRKYDAAQTVAAFAAKLRYEVELDTLTAELLRAIDDTVAPSHLSLWLRYPEKYGRVCNPPVPPPPCPPPARGKAYAFFRPRRV